MEVDGKRLPVEIDGTNNKHCQPLAALDGKIDNLQTIINQTHS
jgi:hypothetical protein